ncbi:unnamed protein product [Calypogeia fissa]
MHEVLRDLGWSLACPRTRRIQGHSSIYLNTSPWPFDKRNPEVKILKIFGNGGQHDPRDEQLSTITLGNSECGLENLKALWLDAVHLRVDCNLFPENLEFLKVRSGLSSGLPLSIPYISDVLCTVLKNMEIRLSPFLTGVTDRIHSDIRGTARGGVPDSRSRNCTPRIRDVLVLVRDIATV